MISRLFNVVAFRRPRTDDGSDAPRTPGVERERRAALSALSALGARGLTLALSLIVVPLTLHYLGPERYGMWFTISSMIALLSFADLGIGYGLLNSVTRSIAFGDAIRAQRQISSAFLLLVILASALVVLLIATYAVVPWPRALGVMSSTAKAEAGPSVAIFIAIFLAGLPLSVGTQVRVARQEAYRAHATAAAGNLVSVVALLLVIMTHQGVPALVVAMAGPPALASVLNALVLFRRDAPELMPSPGFADLRLGLQLLRAGFLFLVLQLAITIAFSTDTIVLAQILGPEAVAEYGVAFRLFTIPIGLIAIGLSPLWPAYGEAIARGDIDWARTTLRRSLKTALMLSVPVSFIFVALGTPIIAIWVGGTVTPSFPLLLGLGIWTVQSSIGQSVAMLLNGADEVRLQAFAAGLMAVANLALSIWLTSRFGTSGVIWGTVITYGALVLVPMALYVPRVLKQIDPLERPSATV